MLDEGFVSLVGAGPGDPELLTLKALRALQSADIVLYDRLVSQDILDLVPSGVSRIAVGKSAGRHCVPQAQINSMLIKLAKSGHRVVRLKGGDPFLFGRGGEETLELHRQQIPFQIIPGIPAATGASAYSGIPLTQRGVSRRVQFITGHFMNDEMLDLDWSKIADPNSTLVIYMGLANIGLISDMLIKAGLDPSMPCALVENATTPRQRRLLTVLSRMAADVERNEVRAPALVIIGKVVEFADQLDWFQSQLDQIVYEQEDYEAPVALA